MRIIDKFIIKQFVSTAIFMVLGISVISVVIDTSERMDDFVKSGLSFWEIVSTYYLGFVPFIISMIFPLMVFIAVIFFTSKMAARSEIVAMLAGGVQFRRVLLPYMIGAFLLSGTFWVATHFWIPKANILRTDFKSAYIDSKSSYEQSEFSKRPKYFYIALDTNLYAGIVYYDSVSKSAAGGVFLNRLENREIVYNLRSNGFKWDTLTNDWKLTQVVERYFDNEKELVIETPEMNIDLNITPNDIRYDKYLKDKMTTPELIAYIDEQERRGAEGLNEFKVERYRRDATPASVFILTVIGMSVASRKTRGGSGLNMAIGIVLAAVFVVMDKFSLTFSTKGNLPPMLSAWTPNIIFSLVAFWLYKRAPK
ncbi:LptF/LptG family permease [Gynurincola endophyticus]|jgi:lipopolysaccharide export system permease protein|uniref:LptF/LptG family permease n=1 Tax=Gynurincola endophyticus TaxID=2479004 RepID=UPI000F8F166F|nr:LptF/LptG family permease [Gynurincola endophyticus]